MMNFIKTCVLLALVFLISCERFDQTDFGFFKRKSRDEKPWIESQNTQSLTVPWKGQAVGADTFINIAKKADLGVVNIGTTQSVKKGPKSKMFDVPQGSPFDDLFDGDFFKHFFGEQQEMEETPRPSLGSGFIINKNGYIVTNNHVVEKASKITVTIGQDREYEAKLVGSDPKTDVALIKIDPKEELTPLELGDSDALFVGEIVVAIGNPFGLSHTVTQGIVSAKERTIGFGPYDNFIQTDASINPGNSGGPLLNLDAKVIGINTAIVASAQGIGFAIPINLAKNIIEQLEQNGKVTRGWLGVVIQKVDDDIAKALNLKNVRGAFVSSVKKSSPADKVGILPRDVIVEVNGKAIKDYNELPRMIASLPVGKKVELKVLRDGKSLSFSPIIAKLDTEQEELASSMEQKEESENNPDRLGLVVETMLPQDAKTLGFEDPSLRGVLVKRVEAQSKAAQKGVLKSDVILEVNKKRVENKKDYDNVISKIKKGDSVLLLIERMNTGTLYIAFTD